MQARVIIRHLRKIGDPVVMIRLRDSIQREWDGRDESLPGVLAHALRRAGLGVGTLGGNTATAVWRRIRAMAPSHITLL